MSSSIKEHKHKYISHKRMKYNNFRDYSAFFGYLIAYLHGIFSLVVVICI